jgi:Ca-activated chloride channel family protein
MSRHALHTTSAAPHRHPIRIGLAALLTLVVAAAIMIKLDATPDKLRSVAAKAPLIGAQCPSARLPTTTVSITVAPELEDTVKQSLNPILTRTLPDRECVKFNIQAQEPAETIQSAAILPLDRAPDIWMPDSSLWESRVGRWKLNQDGSFATSPIVIATSQKAVDELGWGKKKPSWLQALASNRRLAVPEISADAAGLSAVIALWQSLGKGEAAQRALAGTVLAASRAGVPTEAQAIEAVESGSSAAPLLPTSEQAVATENESNTEKDKLVAVQPTGGSPSLDYPVLTMLRAKKDTSGEAGQVRERAIRAVVAQLFNSRSAGIVEAAGFEIPESRVATPAAPTTTDGKTTPSTGASPSPIAGLAPAELAELVARITALSAPSRQLVIFDLSNSMKAKAGNGMTRIQFAAAAAIASGNLLPDRAQVGLWGFSRNLNGKQDLIKIDDVSELGSGTGSHRNALNAHMTGTAKKLGGDGTALYSTAVAGMEEMKKLYDPRAGNAVVIFTDGANEDKGGPSMNATLERLGELYDPKKPVRLVCIGIGSGVDMKELTTLANKANGLAFLAKDPSELPTVLFKAMNERKQQ